MQPTNNQQTPNQLQVIGNTINLLEPSFNQLTASYDAMISFKKECHFAMQTLQQNEFLASTAMRNMDSLRNAILNIASVGLSLNPAEKAAYLVPRDGRVCLDISYMGLCDLATSSGALKLVIAELVREKDEFKYNGVGKEPTHVFEPFKPRGEIVGVYCVAQTPENNYLVSMMSLDECHAIRNRSMAWSKKQSGPWKTDEGEMMKKTVIKRASKLWPKAPKDKRLFEAVEILHQHEGIDFENERAELEQQRQAALEAARLERESQRAEKEDLLARIKTAAGEATKGKTVTEKGVFMVERLGVQSFNELTCCTNAELQSVLDGIAPMEIIESKTIKNFAPGIEDDSREVNNVG